MKQAEKQSASIADYKELFGTQIGQKVLFDLMKQHGVLSQCYVPGDSHSSAFNDGARTVILRIMKRSKIDVKKMMRILEEINKEQEESL